MERTVKQGSAGRWYVAEGHKVVAGPYRSEELARRLTATWNRRNAPRSVQAALPMATPPILSRRSRTAPSRIAVRFREDEEFQSYVAWIGELLMENGGDVEAVWSELSALSEHWDGEPEATSAARAEFDAAVPFAQRQNQRIHG